MKLAGSKKYPWGAGSASEEACLGFDTEVQAQAHADKMNELLNSFGTDPNWNKKYWKVKPEPWVVEEFK